MWQKLCLLAFRKGGSMAQGVQQTFEVSVFLCIRNITKNTIVEILFL